MSYRGVRVLVLGATGFIGRHVTSALVADGADVHASGRNARGLVNIQGAQHAACDVASADEVEHLLLRVQPTIIFNLAGYGVHPTQRDQAPADRINTRLPAQLAEMLPQLPQQSWSGLRLIHAGSALEYGTAAGDLQEGTACKPTTLYGQTKLAGTLAVKSASEANGLKAVTARLFTVYGPGEAKGRLLPALMEVTRTRVPLQLTDGKQLRDFTFVGDVADGLLRLGAADARPGEIVNLATGVLETVRAFALRAARVLGLNEDLLQFGALPTRAEEMAHDPVSITRLRELTAWVPETSIEEGVRKTAGQ